ncbi:MAG: AraC family transcriptional regulator ligand-binding domain-containing protein [Gammaproteobacteria bacterium]|nr:AraC family transcriptional regulator ligand-binding domain-containing protein [Gammaproteobacteria bacterium]
MKASLSGSIASLLITFLDEKGLESPACREKLSHWKPDGRISVTEWAICLMMIYQEYPKPALGLEIAGYALPEHAGLLGYLLLSCDTFGDFLGLFERFYGLLWQGFSIQTCTDEKQYTITWTLNELPPESLLDSAVFMDFTRLAFETGVGGIVHSLRLLCGEVLTPSAISMMGNPPQEIGAYEQFFGCPVSFNSTTTSISFSSELFAVPVKAEKASLQKLIERQAEAELQSFSGADSFLSAFYKVLSRSLQVGTPTISFVADELGVSRATLQRKLNDRSLNFQKALDQTRLEMSKMYLENPRLSLIEISFLLAFSEQSAFSRFFKRATGMTPIQFRRDI